MPSSSTTNLFLQFGLAGAGPLVVDAAGGVGLMTLVVVLETTLVCGTVLTVAPGAELVAALSVTVALATGSAVAVAVATVRP